MDKENEKPPVKRRLCLKLKSPSKRFKTLSDEEFKIVSVQHLPKNTEYAARWCLTNYEILNKEVKRIKFPTISLICLQMS